MRKFLKLSLEWILMTVSQQSNLSLIFIRLCEKIRFYHIPLYKVI
jgi:hypothetical protein